MTLAAPAIAATPSRRSTWPRLAFARNWSLARQYLAASLVVVLAGVLITGAWIGHQIESSVLDRTAGITALYVDSVIGPNLQALAADDRWLTANDTAALNKLVATTGLGQGVVLFKIWSLDGRILYSADTALVNHQFPVQGGLAQAVGGMVSADVSTLEEPENTDERQRFDRLVEVYAPVRQDTDGRVIAVNEFYLLPDALEADIRDAQIRAWALVGSIGLLTYLLLAGIVKRGSNTIRRQQQELQRRFDQNVRLHGRLRQAAERSTSLNEQALRRISADLHDGPAQALALALLRLDSLQSPCTEEAEACARTRADFATVHGAVRDALTDLRAISAGLRLPELERLTLGDLATRAIVDHQRRSGIMVERDIRPSPDQAPLPLKIALVRTLQEALSNATRHGQGRGVNVTLTTQDNQLKLRVADEGPGFDPRTVERSGRLGLAGMRERAELLGGSFEVSSVPGSGSVVCASWPMATALSLA